MLGLPLVPFHPLPSSNCHDFSDLLRHHGAAHSGAAARGPAGAPGEARGGLATGHELLGGGLGMRRSSRAQTMATSGRYRRLKYRAVSRRSGTAPTVRNSWLFQPAASGWVACRAGRIAIPTTGRCMRSRWSRSLWDGARSRSKSTTDSRKRRAANGRPQIGHSLFRGKCRSETLVSVPRPCPSATCESGRDGQPSDGERWRVRERPPRNWPSLAHTGLSGRSLQGSFLAGRPCGPEGRGGVRCRAPDRHAPLPDFRDSRRSPGMRADLDQRAGSLLVRSHEDLAQALKGLSEDPMALFCVTATPPTAARRTASLFPAQARSPQSAWFPGLR